MEVRIGAQERIYGRLFLPPPPPLMPFFWVVNARVTKLAARRSLAVDVAAKTLRPKLEAVYSRRNGVLSDLDTVYSPGRRRNN